MSILSLLPLIGRLIAALLSAGSADILFAGDAMQHKAQLDAAIQKDGSYDYHPCFAAIAPFVSEADYAVVNLETPLGGKPYRGYPCFSAPDSYAEALRDAGFDLMLTANNHTLDCRDRGLRLTVSALDSMAIPHIGTYTDTADRSRRIPFVADIKGFKVGFLNYTYGTNGIEIQRDVVVDYIDRALIAADIDATRRAGAEIVCVAVHWGEEYELSPRRSQTSLAQFLIDHDVDIIFGGHPHVVQPMHLLTDTLTGKNTALIYSLGNFISNMKTRDTRGGALAKVTLRRDDSGKARVDALSYKLIFTEPPTQSSPYFVVYPAEDSISSAWTARRDAFVGSALKVFAANKNTTRW